MKQVLIFILGIITGSVMTLLFGYFAFDSESSETKNLGLTLFSENGDCIPVRDELTVTQVVESNLALAESVFYTDRLLVMLTNNEGIQYYDDQKISIPKGKCARQIGIFKYNTLLDIEKTVPVVVIE